jgi:hypothetical protein
MIAAAIATCEIGFWVLVLGGLFARYRLGRARLGAVLLICVPLVDLALCAFTAADLAGGSTAGWSHGLAAAYLGFGLAFGPLAIRWADRRMLGRGEAKRPRAAGERVTREWRLWRRCLLACLIAFVALGLFVLAAGDAGRSEALWADGGWFLELAGISAAWLLLGPVWATVAEQLKGARPGRSA